MKQAAVITGFFAILALAIIGCLLIFEVISKEASTELLAKVELAILLLGGCAILIGALFKRKSE